MSLFSSCPGLTLIFRRVPQLPTKILDPACDVAPAQIKFEIEFLAPMTVIVNQQSVGGRTGGDWTGPDRKLLAGDHFSQNRPSEQTRKRK
jgi:hypothetical protein